MVIMLDADFSANNIGKIVIAELSEFTKAAIAASGNENMRSDQKAALEVFFDTIGAKDNSGVAAKIERLYMPFIGGNLATALVNYKDNAVDAVLNGDVYQMRNSGIASKIETPSAISSVAKVSTIIDSKDCSFMVMFTENLPIPSIRTQLLAYNGNSGSNRFTVDARTGSANGNMSLYKNHVTPSDLSIVGINSNYNMILGKLMGASTTNNTTEMRFVDAEGTTTIKTFAALANVGTDTVATNLSFFVNASNIPSNNKGAAVGILAIGKGMTEEEMRTFKMAADTLAEAFVGGN